MENAQMGWLVGSDETAQPAIEEHPKVMLNNFLMRYTGKPNAKGDISYEITSSAQGFVCKIRMLALAVKDSTDKVPEFTGDDCENEKLAEQSAARKALDHYA